ncbi:ribose ABC transporter permease [Rhizobium sp. Root149]|jgi:ribose transport system permease protein|uniref:Ribose transport system permease protein n=1 Tax=Rhizobium rhizoryzae TaxID=451876 RepID=A0A7W6LIU9_9HYPH|nr:MULTISPECIES: ABC transporter permease [Rhizobium]KQZ50044.1 ribose ABC transporter permease [Rhizobium sp. Root149]MBB4144173.1 ribose transport system permease protein [Rhizobium rhizoryzae]
MTDLTLDQAGKTKSALVSTSTLQKGVAFVVLIALLVFFSVFTENFAAWNNVVNIMQATAVNGVLGVAVTFVIISGGIDLAVGTMMTLTAVMAGIILTNLGMPLPLGILGAMASGAVMGAISGTAVAKLKIPPFIATLGMMQIARGLALVFSGTRPIYFNDTPNYGLISPESSLALLIPGLEIPNGVMIMFIVAIIASIILNRTLFGRYIFALGSNEEAARLSGVNVDFWKILTYALSGLICGIAGLIISSRLNSAQPALGLGYELDAIAAVVIGGTSLSGGRGTILGTIIGAFIMSVLTNGLRIMGVQEEWKIVVTGVIIIVAVFVDIMLRRRA